MQCTSADTVPTVEKRSVAAAGWKEIAVLLVCVAIPCCFSYVSRAAAGDNIVTVDFGALYYGARCAMHHQDPYNPGAIFREFERDGGHFLPGSSGIAVMDRMVIMFNDNLPTALFFTIPLAWLPWGLAQNAWMILTAVALVVAAFLTWDLGAGSAPLLWFSLAGFMLAETYLLFIGGNVAGIVVSLCIIATWCFLKQRYARAGVLLLAISLVLKPHDAGFVWLYFLLAGRTLRKQALQTLAVTGVLALCAAVWIQPASPHWFQELHSNVDFQFAHGTGGDPGPAGMSTHTAGMIIDLQTVLSGFKDDPHFYDPLAYCIVGLPLLALFITAIRKRAAPQRTRLALAAISALSLLPVYHRINDAVILLLAIPACAMLWKEGRASRWPALVLTAAGILLTSSKPLAAVAANYEKISAYTGNLPGKLPDLFALHPAPFVLLAMGYFYLWLYLRYQPGQAEERSNAATAAISQAT